MAVATLQGSFIRSKVYNRYLYHCNKNKHLERSSILGLKSRRLGIRSNSKQYYCGIHITPGSVLNELSENIGYKFLLGSGGSGSENRKLA
jgi:hypothetical protein